MNAALDSSHGSDNAALADRYAALHAEMLAQYEHYLAVGSHWILYTFLAWEHLLACAGSFYLLEVAHVASAWPFAGLWLGQVAVALGSVTLARVWTRADKSPLQRHVDRVWGVFLLLCWSVAILNVVAGQPLFVFLPVLATLGSFAFLMLTSLLSRRFLWAALVLFITGGLMARFPVYGFLFYGGGWLLVLQGLGVVFCARRRLFLRFGAESSRRRDSVHARENGALTSRAGG
jgi:hypothetical protein